MSSGTQQAVVWRSRTAQDKDLAAVAQLHGCRGVGPPPSRPPPDRRLGRLHPHGVDDICQSPAWHLRTICRFGGECLDCSRGHRDLGSGPSSRRHWGELDELGENVGHGTSRDADAAAVRQLTLGLRSKTLMSTLTAQCEGVSHLAHRQLRKRISVARDKPRITASRRFRSAGRRLRGSLTSALNAGFSALNEESLSARRMRGGPGRLGLPTFAPYKSDWELSGA